MNLIRSLCFIIIISQGLVQAQNITEAEYFLDTDPGKGLAIPISISPGSDLTVNFSVDLSGIPSGIHHLFVRVKDSNGTWSQSLIRTFYQVSVPTSNIAQLEYFIDTDPLLSHSN